MPVLRHDNRCWVPLQGLAEEAERDSYAFLAGESASSGWCTNKTTSSSIALLHNSLLL